MINKSNNDNILSCGDNIYELLLGLEDISFEKEIDLFILSASWEKIKESLEKRINYVITFEEKTFEMTPEQIEGTLNFYSSCFYFCELFINFYFTKDGKFFDAKEGLSKHISIKDLNMFLYDDYFHKEFNRLVDGILVEEKYEFLGIKIKFLQLILNSPKVKLFWNYPDITIEQLKNVYEHFLTNEKVIDKDIVYIGINKQKKVIDAYYHDILQTDSINEKIKPMQIVFC